MAAVDRKKLLDIAFESLTELNEELLDEDRLALDEATILFGDGAALDSMDLVRLVVLYEEKINDGFGTGLCLTDDRAMSQRNSPFQTVASLVDYATSLLKEVADAG